MKIDVFYEKANDYMEHSLQYWKQGEIIQSLGYTIPARIAYLCDTITNIVVLPFAILNVFYGTLHVLCTWNRKSIVFKETYHMILKTSNHLFISAFGTLISPGIAHKYRDKNLLPYLIAARIAFATGVFAYVIWRKYISF